MAKEQPIPPDAVSNDNAVEVLRAFVVEGGLSISFVRAFDDPQMWGMLLVDIARHAARVYEKEGVLSEGEALAAIVDMFDTELAHATDPGKTTARDKQGH